MGKQMEGDNRERRRKAKRARREGDVPSAEGVTQGASKQRQRVGDSEDHEAHVESLREGKQGGGAQKNLPESRPRKLL